ncbi:MAG: hypothetical protein AAB556_01415 [Patescibacteria group bacterium]
MKKLAFLILISFFGALSFTAYASHSSQTETELLSAFRSFAICDTDPNGLTDGTANDSVTFSDGPFRLLYSVHSGGNVQRDDTWKAFLSVNNSEPKELYSYGNCRCSNDPEKGCPGTDNVWWLPMFQDSGAAEVDAVTLTGSAGNKARNTQAGFQGYQAIANYRLCDEKQVANNGVCRTITGSIYSDKPSCDAPCSPRISWNTGSVLVGDGVAQNVVVRKNGEDWQTASRGEVSDSLAAAETYIYTLHGTASDGNNNAEEFELSSVTVHVTATPAPKCAQDLYQATLGVPVTITTENNRNVDWTAPGGSPSSSSAPSSSFTTTYSATGSKTVTITSEGVPATCTVDVRSTPASSTSAEVDLKINGSDGPELTLPEDLFSFVISWGPKDGATADYQNCVVSSAGAGWFPVGTPLNTAGSNAVVVTKSSNAIETPTYGISCTKSNGSSTSDSIRVSIGPTLGSCSLSASTNFINVNSSNRSVSFSVSSQPDGYSYKWIGYDDNVAITPTPGTEPTDNIETFTFNQILGYVPTKTYIRQAEINVPGGRKCVTEAVSVSVGSGTGGGGGAPKSVDVKVKGVNDAVYKDSSTIPYGTAVSISWTSNGVSSCEAGSSPNNQGFVGPKSTSGQTSSVALTTNTSFGMYCNGQNGQTGDTATVSVSPPASPAVDLRIGDQTRGPVLMPAGIDAQLNWSAYNVTDCVVYATPPHQDWTGTVSATASGSKTVRNLGVDTNFTIQCIGPGGNVRDDIFADVYSSSVGGGNLDAATGSFQNVRECEDDPDTGRSDCYTTRRWVRTSPYQDPLSAGQSPANTVGLKFNFPFSANFSGANTLQFDCEKDGSYEHSISLQYSTASDFTADGICNYPNPGTYTAYARAVYIWNGVVLGGRWEPRCRTGPCEDIATIIVSPPLSPPTVALSAPSSVPYNTSATISWLTTDATSCGASSNPTNSNWNQPKSTSGSQSSGNLIANTTFTLSCSGPGGSASKDLPIAVTGAPPTADIKANGSDGPVSVANNSPITLSWSSTNTTSCTASASPPNSNWTESQPTSGSQDFGNLVISTTFTISCSGAGGQASDSVFVPVAPPPAIPDFGVNKSGDIFATIIGTQAISSSATNLSISPFDGFASAVNLSAQSVSPALSGASFDFSDSILTSGEYLRGSSFSVTIPASTPSGIYTITIRAANGGLVRNVNVRLNVNTRDPSFREI